MKKLCIVGLLAFVFAACGGGGGSGGGSGDPTACGSATQGCVLGTLLDSQTSAAVAGATVTTAGVGTVIATANGQGWFSGSGVAEGDTVFCFQKAGYATTCQTFTVTGSKTTNFPPIKMIPLSTPLALPAVTSGTINDATTGAQLVVAPGTLCGSDRTTPTTTQVLCSLTPVGTIDTAPGNFQGLQSDGTTLVPLITGGMMDITCTDASAAAVNLCSNQTAVVRIPAFGWSAGCPLMDNSIDSWSFNTSTGLWEQYATLALTCGASAATSFYQGNINHMSWWNADRPGAFTCLTGSVLDATGSSAANGQATIICELSDASDATGTVRATRSSQSGTDGTFCVPINKSDASVTVAYSCVAKKGQFTSTAVTGNATTTTAACGGDCTNIGNLLLTNPILQTTLTWGASSSAVPSDLDSHFISADGTTQIFYGDKANVLRVDKGSLSSAPFIMLDTDDTTYEGPEVTTVVPGVTAGVYRFCVHNYSGDGDLTTSAAEVFVSGSSSVNLPRKYTVPSSPTGGSVWQVYEVTIDSSNGLTFTDLNKIVVGTDAKTGCLQ